jgi:DNA-directed RNA polymerase subunit RPC12/RpoP
MVPPIFNLLLVKHIMVLVEVRCRKCGHRRVLPRDSRLERVHCRRCGHAVELRRLPVQGGA